MENKWDFSNVDFYGVLRDYKFIFENFFKNTILKIMPYFFKDCEITIISINNDGQLINFKCNDMKKGINKLEKTLGCKKFNRKKIPNEVNIKIQFIRNTNIPENKLYEYVIDDMRIIFIKIN
jgi:hypothetical protein